MSDIEKRVEQVLKLLDQNNENEPDIRNAILNLAFYRQPSMSIVNEILCDIKVGAVQVRDVVYAKAEILVPPLEELLGFLLPLAYQEHFKKRPTPWSVNGIPNSPYIRFALAVGQEFGQSLSRATIATYLRSTLRKHGKIPCAK